MPSTPTYVALVGYGTVGEAVAHSLIKEQSLLREKSGAIIKLKYIIDRDPSSVTIEDSSLIISDDVSAALADKDVSIIIELIGGIDAPRELVRNALSHGKHVVTANKALLAEHGADLLVLAREHGVSIAYEASCGGGIPILRALYSGLISNRIDALYAIINGTCNYILTTMSEKGFSYQQALQGAQELGFAEADPTLDINGSDSAHKLALMTTLAFGQRIDYRNIIRTGIEEIDGIDLVFGNKLGYTLKLIATCRRTGDGLMTNVRPTFLEAGHPLGWVSDAFNAVSIYGNSTGHTLFYGKGAGGQPTASAVLADIIGIATGEIPNAFTHFANWPDKCPEATPVTIDHYYGRYCIRLFAPNRPGLLGKITNILAAHGLNISSIYQELHEEQGGSRGVGAAEHTSAKKPDDQNVPVVITVQRANEQSILSAVEELQQVTNKCIYIPILARHEE